MEGSVAIESQLRLHLLGTNLRLLSCRLRCSLRLKAREQNWHLYLRSLPDAVSLPVVEPFPAEGGDCWRSAAMADMLRRRRGARRRSAGRSSSQRGGCGSGRWDRVLMAGVHEHRESGRRKQPRRPIRCGERGSAAQAGWLRVNVTGGGGNGVLMEVMGAIVQDNMEGQRERRAGWSGGGQRDSGNALKEGEGDRSSHLAASADATEERKRATAGGPASER